MIAADDTRSRSATDCLMWLEGEPLGRDELSFWQFLAASATRYPVKYIPPFKKQAGSGHVRSLIGAHIGTGNDASGQPVPRVLQLYDGASYRAVDVSDGAMGADVFANEALTKARRSAFLVFSRGARVELRLIAQRWGKRLIELGYTVDILMGGSQLKALIIKRGRHRWYLTDWKSLTGLSEGTVSSLGSRTKYPTQYQKSAAITAYLAATHVQEVLRTWFGVGLSLTISATGLRASARYLPDNVVKFKPAPMLATMARIGQGFRGGIVYGRRYRGPSWLIDINRAYTAALRHPLPWRAFLGRCEHNGVERSGMFMCRVTGRRGLRPIYVGRWTGAGVETAWQTDNEAVGFLCILPSVEISGLRACGYTVEPRYGMVYARTFSLAAYVERISQVCEHFGWQSIEAKLTKLLGNGIYGKFAADPTRRDIRLSESRPGPEWRVFVDETGWPVEDLWERDVTKYQWGQHIEVAAEVTARVRGFIYETEARIEASGARVAAVSTDAIVLDSDPRGLVELHEHDFGKFKLSDADADGIVAGANAYAIGEKVIVPDHPNPLREDVVSLFTDYRVEVDAERSGAPRPGAPLSWKIRRRITLPSSDRYTTKDLRPIAKFADALAPPSKAS